MRRPGSITASIVVMLIFAVFLFVIFGLVTLDQKSPDTTTILVGAAIFLLPVAAALADVVFLFVRRKWVYYYNLALFLLVALFLIRFGLFMDLRKESGGFAIALRATGAIYSALIVWLCVDLLVKRRKILAYLSRQNTDEGGVQIENPE
jgi:hypothetical protein